MRNIALLGAGFSFNWGGWLANEVFEYLIGTPEVLANPALRDLLWRHRSHGFEDALAELQRDILAKPGLSLDVTTSNNKLPLRALFDSFQSAVTRMFDEMNAGYMNVQHFWRPDRARSIGDFLPRFDAIFTLNQDLLLEHLYVLELARTGSEKWNGAELPGMQRASRVSERGGELDVKRQEVLPRGAESRDGRYAAYALMRTVPVVVVCPEVEGGDALG